MTEQISSSTGAPGAGTGLHVLNTYTVPGGKTWTLKHALLAVECTNTGVTPEGGEWTISLESDVSGSYAVITESSLETSNRYASQGSGPISHVLTAGQHLRTEYFLRVGKTAADYDHTFAVIYEETP